MKLGRHFTYEEMTATGTRALNKPNDRELVNLVRLVNLVLDPLRDECGAIHINSGFRSEVVNNLVGGSANSYHRLGCAADIRSDHYLVAELSDRVEFLALPFDKLIMEYGKDSNWLHVQLAPPDGQNRQQVFTAHLVEGKMKYTQVM